MPGLSLVTYSYNDHHFVDELLYYTQKFSAPVTEIVVVDDASSIPWVPSREFSGGPDIRTIRHSANTGPSQAKRTGLSTASGDILFSLDADIRPHIGWLKNALSLLADPAIGLVGTVCVPARKAGSLAAALHKTMRVSRTVAESRFVQGGCLLLRRDAWKTIGGLDDFQPGRRAFVDVHLSNKTAAHGLRILRDTRLPVYETRNLHRLTWCRRSAGYECQGIDAVLRKYGSAEYMRGFGLELRDAFAYFRASGDPVLVYALLLKLIRIYRVLADTGNPLPDGEPLPCIRSALAPHPALTDFFRQDARALNENPDREAAVLPAFIPLMRDIAGSGTLAALEEQWVAVYREEDRSLHFDSHYTVM
ncbi:MAG: glycosyltransferase [Desulfovibrio sp.]|jgi:cellulose synthase/poly-beta-1,6-N-acetylglucosamine synthase-like glycosyltransferase|nr:glycosyltransferase [Desulfovibrio sp.]